MTNRQILRSLLKTEQPLVMPDAYDALSARLIEMAGFKAVQCSGFSMALASHAIPEPMLGFERNIEITKAIVAAVSVPVMADGEDGFGPPERVFDVVRAFVEAGVSGINIEDQVVSEQAPKRLAEPNLMLDKLQAARSAAGNRESGIVINARTDAVLLASDKTAGLREAIRRGNLYLEAGSDMVFVTGVNSIEEVKVLVREIRGPVSITAGQPQNVGAMSIRDLRECGVARVSLPTLLVLTAMHAVQQALAMVRDSEQFTNLIDQGLLCGMPDVLAVLKR